MELSLEQRAVVESWGQGMAVLAGAGSGKTTTMVQKCLELLKHHPEARFAAVSFTEKSANDLRLKLSTRFSELGDPSKIYKHWVKTIHGLCSTILKEHPREAGLEGEESVLSSHEAEVLWERACDALFSEALPIEVEEAWEVLSACETVDAIRTLLVRVRELRSFGVMDSLQHSQDPRTRALARLSFFVLEHYERLKQRQGRLDFGDLELGALRILEHPQIRREYQKRLDWIVVDEFQDTNPVQAQILWQLARPDLSNLCVVGDPKQSIYRFRDADVGVFEEYCAKLPIQLSLTRNFRSRPGILTFVNQVCAPLFKKVGLSYEALEPTRDLGEHPPVEQVLVSSPLELAQWIHKEVGRGVPLHEMALLLRKIRGNETWLKSLSSAGIPLAIGSGGLFWEDPRVREVVAFLRWWDCPAHELSGAIFLRAPWVGIPDVQLDEWLQKDRTWVGPFFESAHPLAKALLPYRNQVVRPGELLQALLSASDIEEDMGMPLLGLWHRCEELSSQGLDFHAVILELSRALEQKRRERDVPPPRQNGQLTVLTLHGAKGLEFPHVILIDFPDSPRRSPSAPPLYWDRHQGIFLSQRDELGKRNPRDPIEAPWRKLEKEKELSESLRLFYVALTRAQERLVLVFPEKREGRLQQTSVPVASNQSNSGSESIQDFWRDWILSSEVLERLGSNQRQRDISERLDNSQHQNIVLEGHAEQSLSVARHVHGIVPPKPTLKRARHSVTEWNLMARCPRAYEWTFIRPLPVAEGIQEGAIYTGDKIHTLEEKELSARELGSRVHQCLERGDYEALKDLEKEVGPENFCADPLVSWALSSPFMVPPSEDGSRQVWTELAFEIPWDGEVLVGVIDRLVRQKRGSEYFYQIIDFKVTAHATSPEELLENYSAQMGIYSRALGIIEPASQGHTQVTLVHISKQRVQEVPVSALEVDFFPVLARRIAAGEAGEPKPGKMCRFCEFKMRCSAGVQ